MQRDTAKRLLLLAIIAALVGCYFFFDLGRFLTLEQLKASRESLQRLYADHTAAVIAVYFAGYILMTALSLPGALIVSLAGGAVFGFVVGTVVVSFASTIGATLACAVARFLLRDWVVARFGERIAKIERGIERDGPFYLFTMRLIPAFPFFLINLAMGLTNMPLRKFYWVSQLGMLPGTMVFINAGKQLGQIATPRDILSPELIASFVLLGLFPLAAKKAVEFYRKRARSA